MGFRDRLAGIDPSKAFAEVDGYFYTSGMKIVWSDKYASPHALQIGKPYFAADRLFMFDRIYLATLVYGTMLRLLKGHQQDQDFMFRWISWVAKEVQTNGSRTEIWKDALFVEESSLPLTDHYRSILVHGRGSGLMNRDYTIKASSRGGTSAAINYVADLGRNASDEENQFFGDWLTGMLGFYQQTHPNNMASELAATAQGLKNAVHEATVREMSRDGLKPPTF